MSRTIPRSFIAQSHSTFIKDSSSIFRLPIRCIRPFSSTLSRKAEADDDSSPLKAASPEISQSPSQPKINHRSTPLAPRSPSLHAKARTEPASGLGALSEMLTRTQVQRDDRNRNKFAYDPYQSSTGDSLFRSERELEKERKEMPHLFSVYATRHNTHINVSAWRPVNKKQKEGQQWSSSAEDEKMGYDVLISVSAGNLGFRKSARKHYDSAFQTAAYVMARMQERGWNQDIKKLEVHLRGFGAGREAVTKALLGSEGRFLRGKIVKVADNTRLKFGGTRSKKPRRLG